MKFHAVLDIQLHPGIADPQGSTIERALPTLGFDGISSVRAGKSIHLDVEAADADTAEAHLAEVCERHPHHLGRSGDAQLLHDLGHCRILSSAGTTGRFGSSFRPQATPTISRRR